MDWTALNVLAHILRSVILESARSVTAAGHDDGGRAHYHGRPRVPNQQEVTACTRTAGPPSWPMPKRCINGYHWLMVNTSALQYRTRVVL